jgi:hypothetical protein
VTVETIHERTNTLELYTTLEGVLFESLEVFLTEIEDVSIKRTISGFGTYFISRCYEPLDALTIDRITKTQDCSSIIQTFSHAQTPISLQYSVLKEGVVRYVIISFSPSKLSNVTN